LIFAILKSHLLRSARVETQPGSRCAVYSIAFRGVKGALLDTRSAHACEGGHPALWYKNWVPAFAATSG
jgi:hypothetical protein